MNLRDKRPTNYYKELCQQMPSGKEVQRNVMIGGNITQNFFGNMGDTNKQDKNNHKTAQLFVKLIKSVNRQFSKLSLDNQMKVKESNKNFDIQAFISDSNKLMGNYNVHNIKSNNQGNQIEEKPNQDRKISNSQKFKSEKYTSIKQIRGIASQSPYYGKQIFNIFKNIDPIAVSINFQKGKEHIQKTTTRFSPKMKILTQQSQSDRKGYKARLGNQYSQQCYKTFINTLLFQQKIKIQSKNTNNKSIQQPKQSSKQISKIEDNTNKSVTNNKMNENADVVRRLLEKKGSIGSQKLSTFFQLKRSSFHVAIAYRIYLLQRKKLGFNFEKFQELDPTRHSRILKKQRGEDALIAERKSKLMGKQ